MSYSYIERGTVQIAKNLVILTRFINNSHYKQFHNSENFINHINLIDKNKYLKNNYIVFNQNLIEKHSKC